MLKTERSRGIITRFPGEQVKHTRYCPSAALVPFVEHYWMVQWSLEEATPFIAGNLPHPSAHLVFEKNASRIVGVHLGKFNRRLEGKGHVFAVKFRPCGFYPFFQRSLHTITNKMIAPENDPGKNFREAETQILAAQTADEKIQLTEEFLLSFRPVPVPGSEMIQQLIERVIADRTIVRAEQMAELAHKTLRTLQRYFSQYVGASPKWVIRRYRLMDAVERLKDGSEISFAGLAHELGYADQAHFIRDFKKIIGTSPGEYQKQISG